MFDWYSFENSYLPERNSILNAYYFPDQDYKPLYASISPVNTFRLIFNQFFQADYSLLEDRSYYNNKIFPYLFTEIPKQNSHISYEH
jgi:hypothetical protein